MIRAYSLNKNNKIAVFYVLVLLVSISGTIQTYINLDTDFQILNSTTLPNSSLKTSKELLPHSPISISGNEDFLATVGKEKWIGNGTLIDPYSIENLQISGFSGNRLIEIINVDLPFRIANNFLSGGWAGIYFLNVQNGIIENNTLTYNTGYGISLSFSKNTTIIRNNITNNRYGIWLDTSPNNIIKKNVFEDNGDGLYLYFSEENVISKNYISHSSYDGIYMSVSGKSHIFENIILFNTGYGLNLYNSWDNWILNNTLEANGFNIIGSRPEALMQRDVVNNTINDKPLIFWQNKIGGMVPINAGQIIIINSTQIRIIDQSIFNASIGVLAVYSPSLIIQNVTSSENSRFGIYLYSSENAYIANNTVSKNLYGIHLFSSENSSIIDNNLFSNHEYGIRLSSSSNSFLSGNLVINNQVHGIWLTSSRNNKIRNNTFAKSSLYLSGTNIEDLLQDQVENNYVNGKSIIFWQSIRGDTIPKGTGQVILVNSTSINIINLNLSHTSVGILALFSRELILQNNTISNNTIYGIHLERSESSTISFNTVSSNSGDGIFLKSSDDATIFSNTISHNKGVGVRVYLTNRFEISRNTINDNLRGIIVSSSNSGTSLLNLIKNNHGEGIWILSSWRNEFTRNNISKNFGHGISITVSGGNLIEWNNFLGNNQQGSSQAHDSFIDNTNTPHSANMFQFNYWDDLIPLDKNNDGFSDESYVIEGEANNQDSYPLISPVSIQESVYRQQYTLFGFPTFLLVLFSLLVILILNFGIKYFY
ncbi:MAG: right-handed parallel beta-helix repeat-containing protein [Candidatus Hodarchaeales archaeon]|jgi:parallel beta-helix repeat protein